MKRILILLTLGCLTSILSGQTKEIQKTIFFDSGKNIPKDSISYLFEALNDSIDFNNIKKVVIKGHTDNIGSIAANQLLSEERSSNVYKQLLNFNISEDKIVAEGYSELEPLNENATAELRKQNRRVEIYIWYNEKEEIAETILELDTIQEIDDEVFTENCKTIEDDKCNAFFSGALLSDNEEGKWTSEVFVENEYSQHVTYGEYPNNEEAFQKASEGTLDGLAINEGTRLIIYKKPDFQGKILLDVSGPAIVNNVIFKHERPEIKKKSFTSRLQKLFPSSKRKWSKTNMHRWKKGSMKIICEEG